MDRGDQRRKKLLYKPAKYRRGRSRLCLLLESGRGRGTAPVERTPSKPLPRRDPPENSGPESLPEDGHEYDTETLEVASKHDFEQFCNEIVPNSFPDSPKELTVTKIDRELESFLESVQL